MDLLLGSTGGYSQFQAAADPPLREPDAFGLRDGQLAHDAAASACSLGFRYDALPHAWERNNAQSNFDPSLLHPVGTADLDGGRHHRSDQPGRFHSAQPWAPPCRSI